MACLIGMKVLPRPKDRFRLLLICILISHSTSGQTRKSLGSALNDQEDHEIIMTVMNRKMEPLNEWSLVPHGEPIRFTFQLNNNSKYTSIMPTSGSYIADGKANAKNRDALIDDGCPIKWMIQNVDAVVAIGKRNQTYYYMDFLAYSLSGRSKPYGRLIFHFSFSICPQNIWQRCYRECWGNFSELSSSGNENAENTDFRFDEFDFGLWIVDQWNRTFSAEMNITDSKRNLIQFQQNVPYGEQLRLVIAPYDHDAMFEGIIVEYLRFTDFITTVPIIENYCPMVHQTWNPDIDFEKGDKSMTVNFKAYPITSPHTADNSTISDLYFQCSIVLCVHKQDCNRDCWSGDSTKPLDQRSERLVYKGELSYYLFVDLDDDTTSTYEPHEFTTKPHEFTTKPYEFTTQPHEFTTQPSRTTHAASKTTILPTDHCESNNDYVQNVSCRANYVHVALNHDSRLYCHSDTQFRMFGIFSRHGAGCDGSLVKMLNPLIPTYYGFGFGMDHYKNCSIQYTTIYGAHGHPEAYGTTQYFYAQEMNISSFEEPEPKDGAPQYDFNVYCIFPSETRVSGALQLGQSFGNRFQSGQVVDSSVQVAIRFLSLEQLEEIDQTDVGNAVRAVIGSNYAYDNYDSVLPTSCYFTADQDDDFGFRVPVIEKGCPNTEVLYNWNMIKSVKKWNNTAYSIDFDAFSLSDRWQGTLFLVCDFTMCLERNHCDKPCWN